MASIYSLDDPITKNPFYVGCTRGSLYTRLNQHLNNKKSFKELRNKIDSIMERGMIPLVNLIEETRDQNPNYLEKFWIQQFKAWGFELLNINHADPTKEKRRRFEKVGRPSIVNEIKRTALYKIRAGNRWRGEVIGLSVFPGTVNIRTSNKVYDLCVCFICGAEFIKPHKSKQRYCGYKCRGVDGRGRVKTDSERKNMSLAKMKKVIAIDCSANEIKFNSINDASVALKCSQSSISNVLANRGKSVKGFKFRYDK